MATIAQRQGKHGQTSYRAQVRRRGAPPLSATFTKLSDARKWVQRTEAAICEGRHLPTAEAKRHTLADLIDRYIADILPHKGTSSIRADPATPVVESPLGVLSRGGHHASPRGTVS